MAESRNKHGPSRLCVLRDMQTRHITALRAPKFFFSRKDELSAHLRTCADTGFCDM